MIPSTLAIDAIATYRLTRLITKDTILRPYRARVIRAAYGNDDDTLSDIEWEQRAIGDDEAPRLAELVVCRYCVGVYVGFVVAAFRYRRVPWTWDRCGYALTCASAGVLLAGLEKS